MSADWPPDIDPGSGMRLPIPNRDSLDEAARQVYDRATTPGASIAGLQGPGGIQLYSPKLGQMLSGINRHLRYETGFTGREREIAILATAREMDSQFEWVAHEDVAVQEGVPAEVIEAIKHRRPTTGLPPADAFIVGLAREIWRDHKVKPETFAAGMTLFGPRKLVELVMLMGNYAGTAALLALVDMQLHDDRRPLLPVP
jgi:4-carboxymuconolactone decarboxylase